MLGPEAESWNDLIDVEKVLRCIVAQLDVIIRREREKTSDHRNIRLAEDFALKAKIAKAREAAPAHRQLCPSGQSHK